MHIRGYGLVHIVGAEFKARKRRKVDLISFDKVIKIKVFKFECTMEHSNEFNKCNYIEFDESKKRGTAL